VSQYQKGKTNLDFTDARDSEWQWHQLGHMQACTSLQTDKHASTPPLSFFTGQMLFLPTNQQRQSIEGNNNGTHNTIIFTLTQLTKLAGFENITCSNKAVIDCRLRPRCCHLGVTLSTRHFRVAIYAGTICASMMSQIFNTPTAA